MSGSEMTHDEILAYRKGLKHAAYLLAVWRDGKQYVGVRQEPLAQVEARIDRGEWD